MRHKKVSFTSDIEIEVAMYATVTPRLRADAENPEEPAQLEDVSIEWHGVDLTEVIQKHAPKMFRVLQERAFEEANEDQDDEH